LKKKIKPPFLPKVKSSTDVSHFDAEFTECEVESYKETMGNSPAGKVYTDFSYQSENMTQNQNWVLTHLKKIREKKKKLIF